MRNYDWQTAKAMARVAIDGVGLEGKYLNLPAELSGGEQQRISIARAVAGKPKILFADEPTANLDPKARDDFYRLLKENEKEKISLFVTHRLDEVKDIVNRQIYMDLGKIESDDRV